MNLFKFFLCLSFAHFAQAESLPYFNQKDFTPLWETKAETSSRIFRMPPFRAQNQEGRVVTRENLLGRPSLVNFFFTSCQGICPMTMGKLDSVRKRLDTAGALTVVSFSITPKVDTPEKMKAFISKRNLETKDWELLTGDAKVLSRVARVFQANKEVPSRKPGEFVHSENVYLLDSAGLLRGVYNLGSAAETDLLEKDVRDLTKSQDLVNQNQRLPDAPFESLNQPTPFRGDSL